MRTLEGVPIWEWLRAARGVLRRRTADLAERARLNLSTVQRAEKADGPVRMMPANARPVRQALEAAGIRFTDRLRPVRDGRRPPVDGPSDVHRGLVFDYITKWIDAIASNG